MTTHRAYRTGSELNEWARQLLALPLDAVLATISPDGSPHTAPVGFAYHEERILVASGSTTRKVRNLESDPRARLLVMARAASTGIDDGWVAASGQAEIVRGEEGQRLGAIAVGRYLTEEGKRGYAEVFLPLLDVTIVLTPTRWQTWDESGMLQTMFDRGYTEEDVARWYVER